MTQYFFIAAIVAVVLLCWRLRPPLCFTWGKSHAYSEFWREPLERTYTLFKAVDWLAAADVQN